jgi:hypothetical protein
MLCAEGYDFVTRRKKGANAIRAVLYVGGAGTTERIVAHRLPGSRTIFSARVVEAGKQAFRQSVGHARGPATPCAADLAAVLTAVRHFDTI